MNKEILQRANAAFNELKTRYDKFVNVGVDNWRGFRFIFDTEDVQKCNNECPSCELFQLVNINKDQGDNVFSSGLYSASEKDKELFGPNIYLNCKTFSQYQKCYSNWLVEKTNTEEEIDEELNLVRDFNIIYSREENDWQTLTALEREFKKAVVEDAIKRVGEVKRETIIRLATKKEII